MLIYTSFRFEDVLALQTFDANGDITDYVGDVNSEVYNFFGPGSYENRQIYIKS